MSTRVAVYGCHDLKCGQRLHHWNGDKFAIGNGPIRYITEAECREYLRRDKETVDNSRPSRNT